MRFDDRLATVLAQPVGSPRDRVIRWRQLVDLVARSGGKGDPVRLAYAVAAIREQLPNVREDVRAATARAISGLPVPLPLLEVFAADRLAVAAPLLAAMPLDEAAFAALTAVASNEVKPFLATLAPPPRRPAAQRREPPPAERKAPVTPRTREPEPETPPAKAEPVPSISEVVARIERLRSTRERSTAAARAGDGAPIAGPVPLGMQPERRDRLGRGRAPRRAGRPVDHHRRG